MLTPTLHLACGLSASLPPRQARLGRLLPASCLTALPWNFGVSWSPCCPVLGSVQSGPSCKCPQEKSERVWGAEAGQQRGQEGSETQERPKGATLAQFCGELWGQRRSPLGVSQSGARGLGYLPHCTCQSLGEGCPSEDTDSRELPAPTAPAEEPQRPEADRGAGSWKKKHFRGPHA